MCIQVLSEFPIIYITCTYMQMNIECTIHAHIMRNIFVFYSLAIGQLQCDFKYFALHFFCYFLTVQGQQKILSIFCLNCDHYSILKKKDCAALFQCYKFLLIVSFVIMWWVFGMVGYSKARIKVNSLENICVFFCTDIHVATCWNV